jgi:hypothetical protein
MVRSRYFTVNLLFMLCAISAQADELLTNFVRFPRPPVWLTSSMVEKATGPIQNFLQWDIRRIQAFCHSDQAEFEALHGMGPGIKAFFRRSDSTLHLGPEIGAKNFQPVFQHELVHAIFFQKYKGAIPTWMEEGLANYLGKTGPVDYVWLSAQPYRDVTSLSHPSRDLSGSRYHYQASTAVTEYIASKCSLHDLLELSVGRKLEKYLSTFCEIKDVNSGFQKWVRDKAAAKPKDKPKPALKKMQLKVE